MKRNVFGAMAALLGFTIMMTSCNTQAVTSSNTQSVSCCDTTNATSKVKHVIIIGIDGMSVGGLQKAHTPAFDKMMTEGSYSLCARNVFPTSSSPNWNAMLTSASASMTGVSSNDWRHDDFKLPPVRVTEHGWFPDVFYALKQSNTQCKTASIYHWDGFGNLYDHTHVDFDKDSETEDTTMADAIAHFKAEKPNFLFIQLDHVDHWGHTAGHMTERYLQSVEHADSLVGRMLQAIESEGLLDETLILVNADHGGKEKGHGHESVEGNTVPYLFYGASVRRGYEIQNTVSHFNLAPLSVYALGAKAPEVWLGDNLSAIFEGEKASNSYICGKLTTVSNLDIAERVE